MFIIWKNLKARDHKFISENTNNKRIDIKIRYFWRTIWTRVRNILDHNFLKSWTNFARQCKPYERDINHKTLLITNIIQPLRADLISILLPTGYLGIQACKSKDIVVNFFESTLYKGIPLSYVCYFEQRFKLLFIILLDRSLFMLIDTLLDICYLRTYNVKPHLFACLCS